eukprot:5613290-Karenia_brevis.AAC.1
MPAAAADMATGRRSGSFSGFSNNTYESNCGCRTEFVQTLLDQRRAASQSHNRQRRHHPRT